MRPLARPLWSQPRPSRSASGLRLSERIREKIDPDELIDIALAIARGHGVPVGPAALGEVAIPSARDRISALNWLADRGWLKPPSHIAIAHASGNNSALGFARLPPEQLDELERLLALAAGEEPPEPEPAPELVPAGSVVINIPPRDD